MPVLHPLKINVLVDLRCESHYLFIVSKKLPRCEYAAEQQRRVDRRDLAIPSSGTGARVHPVIEPAVFAGSSFCEKAKGCARTIASCLGLDPTAGGRDAQRCKTESGSGDAGHTAMS